MNAKNAVPLPKSGKGGKKAAGKRGVPVDYCSIKLTLDKTTSKRSTLFDQAKLKLFQENGLELEDKSQIVIRVSEDRFRLVVQELHDSMLAEEYS